MAAMALNTAGMPGLRRQVTIRDYIRRRVMLGYGLAFAGFALAVAFHIFHAPEGGNSPLFFIAFIPFLAAIVFINFGIKCPRCKGNLAMTPAASPSLSKKHRFNFCP
jgi:hypothetical protein